MKAEDWLAVVTGPNPFLDCSVANDCFEPIPPGSCGSAIVGFSVIQRNFRYIPVSGLVMLLK